MEEENEIVNGENRKVSITTVCVCETIIKNKMSMDVSLKAMR